MVGQPFFHILQNLQHQNFPQTPSNSFPVLSNHPAKSSKNFMPNPSQPVADSDRDSRLIYWHSRLAIQKILLQQYLRPKHQRWNSESTQHHLQRPQGPSSLLELVWVFTVSGLSGEEFSLWGHTPLGQENEKGQRVLLTRHGKTKTTFLCVCVKTRGKC